MCSMMVYFRSEKLRIILCGQSVVIITLLCRIVIQNLNKVIMTPVKFRQMLAQNVTNHE